MTFSLLCLGFGIGGITVLLLQALWEKIEERIEKYEILRDQNEARKTIKIDIK